LVLDAAQAFGSMYANGNPVGSAGDAEVFSFHATKFFNSGEGGAVVTNDDEVARAVRLMKNFGFSDYDTVIDVGTNGKMTELAAAMGLTSLESLDDFVAVNRRNHRRYGERLAGLPGVKLLDYDESERCNFQYVVLEVDELSAAVGRDRLLQILHAENVLARRYFYPGCHRMEPYRSAQPEASSRLPETERIAARVLVLPTGTSVGDAEIDAICAVVRLAVEQREPPERPGGPC
jgi:dTDP-4-amino-4,6-dideoxygalactose transaminase